MAAGFLPADFRRRALDEHQGRDAAIEKWAELGGAKVYLAVRDVESAGALVAQYGDSVEPVQLDVTDDASIKGAAKRAGRQREDVVAVAVELVDLWPQRALTQRLF